MKIVNFCQTWLTTSAVLIVLFFYIFLSNIAFADSIVVDESLIRGQEEHKGLMTLSITAFSRCDDRWDILPMPYTDRNGDKIDDHAVWLLPVIFDTGCSNLSFINIYGAYGNPGVSLGFNNALSVGITVDEFVSGAIRQWVVGSDFTCLNLHLNGFNAVDPATGMITGSPPSATITGVVPSVNTLGGNGVTLICMPAVNRVSALIDGRQESVVEIGGYTAPRMVFNPLEGDSRSGPARVDLQLYRLLDDDPLTVDRLQISPITFKDSDLSVEDQFGSRQFLFDTGTTFTTVSRDMASDLGLLSRSADFNCQINSYPYPGYIIDQIEMEGNSTGRFDTQRYVVQNAHICVEDDNPDTPRILKNPQDGSIADYQAVIGMNLFQQVRVLLNGPDSTLSILTDVADLDGNLCVDQADLSLLTAELDRSGQTVTIQGHVEIGKDSYFLGSHGEGWWIHYNFIAAEFSSDGPVEIVAMDFDFSGQDVIVDADGPSSGISGCGTSYNRRPDPLTEDTPIFGVDIEGFGINEQCAITWDFDKTSNGDDPFREDYYNGSVVLTFSNGSTAFAIFNATDSQSLARNSKSAASTFSLTIPDFKPQPDDMFDINGDGMVNTADKNALIALFTNPAGAPCKRPGFCTPADIDGDCDADGADLQRLAKNMSIMSLSTFALNFGRTNSLAVGGSSIRSIHNSSKY